MGFCKELICKKVGTPYLIRNAINLAIDINYQRIRNFPTMFQIIFLQNIFQGLKNNFRKLLINDV